MHRLYCAGLRHAYLRPAASAVQTRLRHQLASRNPFLVGESELVPGIEAVEVQLRRQKAVQLLPPNSLLILNAAEEKYMSHDIPYDFRQDSHFLYLTGLDEPDAVAVLKKNADESSEYILFVRPRDAHSEQWVGPRVDVHSARTRYLADAAYTLDELETHLVKLAAPETQLFLTSAIQNRYPSRFLAAAQSISQNHQFQMADSLLDQLRVIKSPAEIARMQEATSIGSDAFCSLIKGSYPGQLEVALAGHFEAECRARGAPRNSFPCVVGAGPNAAVIHYLSKRSMLRENELVLMDAGCEINGNYVSDITRTWPRLRQATEQKVTLSLDELHRYSVGLLGEGMKDFGIVPNHVSLNSTDFHAIFRAYNPTHLSHYLGMDVHDTPRYSRSLPLQPGMVVTVEPGIYLPLQDTKVPAEFRGIGIRIEDDVLITETGIEILTSRVPKTISELESFVGSKA
ncbi:unnamed protein product [Aphanomyces euteiches]